MTVSYCYTANWWAHFRTLLCMVVVAPLRSVWACALVSSPAPLPPPLHRYMAELSKHVPIIPVIMKADTMTIHEAQRFRQEVVNRLQNPSESPRQAGRGAQGRRARQGL